MPSLRVRSPRTYYRKTHGIAFDATPPTTPESNSARENAIKKNAPTPTLMDSADKMVTVNAISAEGCQKSFVFHKSFICHYSPYLNAMFNGRFLEAQAQSTIHHTVSLNAFGIFATWIYTQVLVDAEGKMPNVKDLVDVWIDAEPLLVPSIQNKCIEALNEMFNQVEQLPTELFAHIYDDDHTSEDSPLRKFFVDLCASRLGKIEFGAEYPRKMLVDILKASGESKPCRLAKFSKESLKKYMSDEAVRERR